MAGLEGVHCNQETLTGPIKVAGLEGVHCNQDTLTGPKGGWIRGSSLLSGHFDWSQRWLD